VLVVLAVGFLAAVMTSWQALAYNAMAALSGGLTVELEPESGAKVIVLKR
jgi:hypothetical protein